jgi:hypothetical protein
MPSGDLISPGESAPEVFAAAEPGGLRQWMATIALLNAQGLCTAEFVDEDGKQLEAEVLAANEGWRPGDVVRVPAGRSWSDRSWLDRPWMKTTASVVVAVRPQARAREHARGVSTRSSRSSRGSPRSDDDPESEPEPVAAPPVGDAA